MENCAVVVRDECSTVIWRLDGNKLHMPQSVQTVWESGRNHRVFCRPGSAVSEAALANGGAEGFLITGYILTGSVKKGIGWENSTTWQGMKSVLQEDGGGGAALSKPAVVSSFGSNSDVWCWQQWSEMNCGCEETAGSSTSFFFILIKSSLF